jgi:hypothetical protein
VLNKIHAPLLALALVAVPAGLPAQQKTAPGAARTSAPAGAAARQREMQAWYSELQQIGARLQQVKGRALQASPVLRAREEALAKELKAAMLKADPSLAAVEGRAPALEAEGRKAQQAGDQAKLMKLMEEARQIELRVMSAQQKVLQDPAMVAKLRAFETDLRKKMVEVEPQLPQLLQRAELLKGKLQAALGQQGGR